MKYKVIVIERIELEAIIEAPNAKTARRMGREHEFDVDEKTALNLPTQVSSVERITPNSPDIQGKERENV